MKPVIAQVFSFGMRVLITSFLGKSLRGACERVASERGIHEEEERQVPPKEDY